MDVLPQLESCATYCLTNYWNKVKDSLQEIVSNESGLQSVPPGQFLQSMNEILKSLSEKLVHEDEKLSRQARECTAEGFRCLRQACTVNSELQSLVSSCVDLLANTKSIIEKMISLDPQGDSDNVLKCAAQFLGNACASNVTNQKIIWDMFFPLFSVLLHHSDSKVCDYTCMLVHTCLTTVAKNDQNLLTSAAAQDIVLTCIESTAQKDIEWGLYVLEDLLKNDIFLPRLYEKMGQKERLLLMEVILAEMSELPDDSKLDENSASHLTISEANLRFIAENIRDECNLILKLKTPESTDQEMALVIAKELEILSMAAQHILLYPNIQQDGELLKCAVNLLASIHDIGKSGKNVFSIEEKATGLDSIDAHHPVFGLKKDLIRLIANMTYKHRGNQDLVRTLEGIPLLLDLTRIDCHNPCILINQSGAISTMKVGSNGSPTLSVPYLRFITQWVVLAIRNLVENNRENRDVLSGMSLQGMAGHMAALREVGVHTELRGGKIVVKPVDD